MIRIDVRTKYNHIPIIAAQIRPAVSQVVKKTAYDVEADVKTEMAERPKHGRLYGSHSRGMGLLHQASAPGEAPAVDTGLLINSIQVENVTDLTSTVGTNVEYATPLEFGSRRIAARPVWRKVLEARRKPFIQAITFVLRQLK